MKKIMKTLSLLLAVGAMVFGSGLHQEDTKVARAEGTIYKTALFGSKYNSKGNSSYTDSWYATNNGFKVNIKNANNNNNKWSYIKMGSKKAASVGSITTDDKIDKPITKIVVTVDAVTTAKINSTYLYISDDTKFNNGDTKVSVTIAKGAVTYTVPQSARGVNKYYQLVFDCAKGSDNGLVTISKVEYYTDDSIGGDIATITLSNSTLDLEVGQSETITATVNPSTDTVEWSSNATSVATVENGRITAVGAGTAIITATSSSGKTATCTVNVTEPLVLDHEGTVDDPYSVADALKVIGTLASDETTAEKYYVKGVVSSISEVNTSFGNATFYIHDENVNNSLYAYRINYLDDAKFTSTDQLKVGNKVIIVGNLQNYNGNTPEIKTGYIASFIYELDQEKINEVILLIDSIGNVEYTTISKEKIDAARSAYNELNNDEKEKVTNIDILNTAEETYDALELEATKIELAQAIINQINAIGEVTDYSKADQIAAARTAYEAAEDVVKVIIDANGATQTLIDAEIELAKYAPKYYEIIFLNNLTEGDSSTDNGSNLDSAYENITPDGIKWGNGSKVYNGKNSSVKLGSGSAVGYFNLSITDNNYYISEVIVVASQYGSDTSKIQIEIGEKTQDSSVLTSTKTEYSFDVSELKSNSVKIGTSGKRGYIYSVTLYYAEHTSDIDQAKVDEVVEKINNIGTPNASLTFKKDLEDAEAAFEALTSAEQEAVTNASTLTSSRETFNSLVTYSDQYKGINQSYDATKIEIGGLILNTNIAGNYNSIGYSEKAQEKAVAAENIAEALEIDSTTTGVVTLHTYFYDGFLSLDLTANDAIKGTVYYLGSADGGITYSVISSEELNVASGNQIDLDVSTSGITDLVIAFVSTQEAQRMILRSVTYYSKANAENADILLELLSELDTCTEYDEATTLREMYENDLTDYERIIFNRSNIADNDKNGNEISVNALEKLEYMEYLAGLEKQSEGLSSNLLSNITSSNNILIILVVGLLGLTSILGYYFLNRKKYAK